MEGLIFCWSDGGTIHLPTLEMTCLRGWLSLHFRVTSGWSTDTLWSCCENIPSQILTSMAGNKNSPKSFRCETPIGSNLTAFHAFDQRVRLVLEVFCIAGLRYFIQALQGVFLSTGFLKIVLLFRISRVLSGVRAWALSASYSLWAPLLYISECPSYQDWLPMEEWGEGVVWASLHPRFCGW